MKFRMEVITPERVVFRKDIDMVIVPGSEGELAVMARHIPFMTGLKPGVVRIKADQSWEKMAVGGGILQVTEEKTSILADTAELAEEIDVERARKDRKKAIEQLEKAERTEMMKARLVLEKSIARLKAKEE